MKTRLNLLLGLIFLLVGINSCTDDEQSPNQDDQIVATPFGLISKSKVHLIEDGYATKIENNHLLKIEKSTGKVIKDFGKLTPSEIDGKSGRVAATDPTYVNDIIVGSPNSGTRKYTSFSDSWIVPPSPTQNTQTIFIGARMLILSSFDIILETVLQYGVSVAGGGQYWSVASWQLTSGIVTHSSLTQVAPGAVLSSRLQYSGNAYNAYFSGLQNSNITLVNSLVNSTVTVFLGGVPKTTGAYPPQFSVNIYDIDLHATTTYPTLSWSGTSGALGEHIKAINNTNKYGTVSIRFYGTPSAPHYPNNGAYPKTLAWTGTPRALSYEISYYTLQPGSGNRTNYMGYSTTSPFIFPFVQGDCSGCGLISKVRAVYEGGVVSDWSPEINMTFGY